MMNLAYAYGRGGFNCFRFGLFSGIGGWIMMIVGLLLIGFLIYLVYDSSKKKAIKIESHEEEAIQILNMRFAKGEIGEEEYRARKAALMNR